MKKNSVLALALLVMLSSSAIVSCKNSTTDNIKNNTEKTSEDVKKVGEDIKEEAKDVGENIKYTAINFKDDIVNAGYDIKEYAEGKKAYFTGKETNYKVGNDSVYVYEYDSADKIEEDIKNISENGLTINGKTTNFTTKPYYYRKGNTLIMYEGNESKYIDNFKKLYGDSIR
ncbi:YtxH domain-containing protein [Clostridium weizhouense]|uniref:YtxH domain-containing protein n=1 Tax=Clostridium weizhouense TaxID=2859781 RepID=A0ABS7ALK1_9CLOT|nr:YtxH domain-containing protein [Clostridium weizhouense]MBW6409540.1 YtxH domain-containing protein [Clostridium weizhouense]